MWKTIELGTYRTNTELFDAIRSQGMVIDQFAADLGKRSRLARSQRTVDLVRVRVGTLCLGSGTDGEAQRKAQQIGLQICPPEVGFQLRRQYLDQPEKEELIIAMKEMVDFDGDVSVLSVLNFPEHNDGPAIHGVKGHAGWLRSADTWLAFIQPR